MGAEIGRDIKIQRRREKKNKEKGGEEREYEIGKMELKV